MAVAAPVEGELQMVTYTICPPENKCTISIKSSMQKKNDNSKENERKKMNDDKGSTLQVHYKHQHHDRVVLNQKKCVQNFYL